MLNQITSVTERVFGCTRLCAVEFSGADPTGIVDATNAINKAISSLPAVGGEVHIPAGKYLIDATIGISMRSNLYFHMDPAAEFVIKTNNAIRYGCLRVNDVSQVRIDLGTITGDRDTHIYTPQAVASQSTHEWGHAIQCYGSQHVTFNGGLLRNCTGDGISMSGQGTSVSDDIALIGVVADNNRRQGCSIGKTTNVVVKDCKFTNTNGTPPQCGVDIEPENGGSASDIYIVNCIASGNVGNGILTLRRNNVTSPVSNVSIVNSQLTGNKGCGLYSANTDSLFVSGNNLTGNLQTGFHIGTGCTNVHVSDNIFGANYKTKPRALPVDQFGFSSANAPDILALNDPAQNLVGDNTFI